MPQDANKNWMADAFANSHGQFKAKARKHGESTKAYANEASAKGSHASTKTKRQANLVKTVAKINAR